MNPEIVVAKDTKLSPLSAKSLASHNRAGWTHRGDGFSVSLTQKNRCFLVHREYRKKATMPTCLTQHSPFTQHRGLVWALSLSNGSHC